MTDLPDESTIRIPRNPTGDSAEGVTELSARRGNSSEGTTEPSGSDTAEPAVPRRRTAAPGAGDTDLDADEGSTIVARRESRRRASRAIGTAAPAVDLDGETIVVAASGGSRGLAATLAGDVPAPLGRVAQAPAQTSSAYGARPAEPVIVGRAAPEVRAPQPPVDLASVEHAARRRARRRVGVVVAVSAVIVLLAASAILILVTL